MSQDLDQSIMTQDVEFTISQAYPCGQKSRTQKPKVPMDDSEMLTYFMTCANNSTNKDHIIKSLSLIKHSVSFEQNLKNLTKASKEDLKKTLGFLMNESENSDFITQYKVEGMRIVLLELLIKLMPKFCKLCKNEEPYFQSIGENPDVACIRCKCKACPNCFKSDDSGGGKWKYICEPCNDIVAKQASFEAIGDDYKMKNSKSGKDNARSESSSSSARPGADLLEEEEEESPSIEEDLENDQNFAEAMSRSNPTTNQGNGRLSARTVNPEIVTEVCSYFIKGQCRHGFSGKKAVDGKNCCGFLHPKVCDKLFKYGYERERGCNGRNCPNFHPSVCKDSRYGNCIGRECKKGFHIRSITKFGEKRKRESDKKEKVEERKKEKVEERKKEKVSQEKKVSSPEKNIIKDNNCGNSENISVSASFLEKMEQTMRTFQANQEKQQDQIMALIKSQGRERELSPPDWFLRYLTSK